LLPRGKGGKGRRWEGMRFVVRDCFASRWMAGLGRRFCIIPAVLLLEAGIVNCTPHPCRAFSGVVGLGCSFLDRRKIPNFFNVRVERGSR